MASRIKLNYSRRALAIELGIQRETLERRASRAGVNLDNLSLRDLVKMLTHDKASAIARKLETEIALNEIEIKEKQGELVDREGLISDLWQVLGPFRNDLLALRDPRIDRVMAKHREEIDKLNHNPKE